MSDQRNSREVIKQAYVDSIRSVLILDDRYPDYSRIGDDLDDRRYDVSSAIRLWQGFRAEHRTCDISSARSGVSDSFLDRLDLLVLDYDLQLEDAGHTGKTAREIIRGLAKSTRQNMVIVYTAHDNLIEVQLEISASLAALPDLVDMDDDAFRDWREEHRYTPDYKSLFSYIQQTDEWKKTEHPLRFVEEQIHRRLRNYFIKDDEQVAGKLEVSHGAPHWIRIGSVFVTLLQKDVGHTANDLLDHLIKSLEHWDPSFMRLMLAYARAGIVDQGISGDDRLLRDAETEAAWMFYTDESADFHERRERVGILYTRLVDDLLTGSLERLLDFSKAYGGEQLPKIQDRLKHAMERLNLASDDVIAQRRVVHKINHYLAFERGFGRHLRAGTVFWDCDNMYGVVTTPDCDLVPGRDRGLGTTLRVIYRPAFVVTTSGKIKDAYDRASDFKHMFLHVPDESIEDGYLVLGLHAATGKPSDHPPAGVLYVANDGRLNSHRCFMAQSVNLSEEGTPVLESPRSFRVLAQLRDRYALRLLHEAGHHLSRTGVDFVPWK